MADSIRKQFISGVAWSTLSRFSSLGIQFVVTLILARLLDPSDFGVIGMLSIFMAVSQILLDSGFGDALIQKESKSDIEYSSVFYLNILIGVLCYSLLFLVSPLLDDFYHMENLHTYSRILFLVIPINAIGLIQRVQLRQELAFKKIAIIEISSALISGIVGVFLAYLQFGVYALICQMLIVNICRTSFTILFRRWHPSFVFSLNALKPLFSYGLNLTITGLLTVIFNNIHALLIGRFYNPQSVGYYNQAKQYEQLSSNTLTDIVMGVSFPTLVRFKDNEDKLKEFYKKIIELVVFLVVPLMCFLYVVSDQLLVLLLTEKWLPASVFFKILCIYGITFPLHQINGNVIKVKGESRKYLCIELFRRVLLLLSIIVTLNISIIAMLYGQIIAMFFVIIASMYVSGSLVKYRVIDQIIDILPYYIMGIISSAFAVIINDNVELHPVFNITMTLLLLIVVYLFLCFLFKRQSLYVFVNLIKNRKK